MYHIKLEVLLINNGNYKRNENWGLFLPSWIENRVSKEFSGFKIIFSSPEGTKKPQFLFHVLFLISDKKQRLWYITRRKKFVYFGNENFLLPFHSIARWSLEQIKYPFDSQFLKKLLSNSGLNKYLCIR